MKIDAKNVPLNEEFLYRYLLNTELFPIGYKGSREQFFERLEREHERLGGAPCNAKKPLQLIKSCLKTLTYRGFYKLRFRNLWEHVEFDITMNKNKSDRTSTNLMNLAVVSSIGS